MDKSQYEICKLVEEIEDIMAYIENNVNCPLDHYEQGITIERLEAIREDLLKRL